MTAESTRIFDAILWMLGGAPSRARLWTLASPSFWTFSWAAFGLILGSFVNVLIHRLPLGLSIVQPGSRCPKCLSPIAWFDNIPVASFLLLRGRCRRCREPISRRYPLVELLVGALAAGLSLRWGQGTWTAFALAAAAALVAIAFIDWDSTFIPDELSLGLIAAGLLAAPMNPILGYGRQIEFGRLIPAACGAAAGYLGCLLVALIGERLFGKEAMGGGDLKLLGGVGAWTGALGALDCIFIAAFLGSAYGLGRILKRSAPRYRGRLEPLLERIARRYGRPRTAARAALWRLQLLRGRIHREPPIPFGPFLSAGALFNFFYLLPVGFPFNL